VTLFLSGLVLGIGVGALLMIGGLIYAWFAGGKVFLGGKMR
jgi:hypothetical protein